MGLKIAYGIVAAALVVIYLLAPAVKLKDPALTSVLILGILMMAVDLWQSIKNDE